jgi:hypothetical protein
MGTESRRPDGRLDRKENRPPMHADKALNRRASACIGGRKFFLSFGAGVRVGGKNAIFYHRGAGARAAGRLRVLNGTDSLVP